MYDKLLALHKELDPLYDGDDMARVFDLLCQGVRAYAKEWEQQDINKPDDEPSSLSDAVCSPRILLTIGAIKDCVT